MKHIIKAYMAFDYNPNITKLGYITPNYPYGEDCFTTVYIH